MHRPAVTRRRQPPPRALPLRRRISFALLQILKPCSRHRAAPLMGFNHTLRADFHLHMGSLAGFPVEAGGAHGGAGAADEELPRVDVFICTADPKKEPVVEVMNTVISAMAMEYPPEKLAVYLSDDGGAAVTLYAMKEACLFARSWLPFCRKYGVKTRCPEAFLSSFGDAERELLESDEFDADEEKVQKNEGIRVDDESKLPLVVYVSREKRPSYPLRFKAGALNALLRVSGIMSNAPYALVLDCDMYCNDPTSAKQAMCFHLDPQFSDSLAYAQFPQIFYNVSKNDIYDGQARSANKDALVQLMKWASGLVQFGLSRFSPLIYGMSRMHVLQSMCYGYFALSPLLSAACLLYGIVVPLCFFYGVPLSAEEITHIMDGIASNSFQMKIDRSNHHRVAQVEESDAMKTMMMTLMEKIDAFSSSSPRETLPPLVQEQQGVQEVNYMGKQNFQEGNYNQGKPNFQSQQQGTFQQGFPFQQAQGRYNANSNFQGGNPSSFTPNFKNHENFSYANQRTAVQFPPGFNPGAKPPNNEGRPSQDDAMEAMFKKMDEFMKCTMVWRKFELKRIFDKGRLKMSGPLVVTKVHLEEKIEVRNSNGDIFVTNEHHVKYFIPPIPKEVPNINPKREV
ncbi:hypothetical protein ACS0TY_014384 [Phlomoides rotata]